jgi:integrase/recombinase XerD
MKDWRATLHTKDEPFSHLSAGFHPPFRNLSGRGNRGEATETEGLDAEAFRESGGGRIGENEDVELDTAFVPVVREHLDEMKRRNFSKHTIENARRVLNRFIVFIKDQGVARIQDVTESHLEQYRLFLADRKRYAESTAIQCVHQIKKFFDTLAGRQVIFVNPAENIPKQRKPVRLQPVPTETEIKRLLNQPDISAPPGIRDRAIIELFYSTGIRHDEMARLNVNDPQLKHHRLRIFGKGRKERVVPVGKHAMFWLERYLREVRPLLQSNPDERALWLGDSQGKRLNDQLIRRYIRRYWEKARIRTRITPHSLRRACATHMLRNGAHPVEIQMLLGHAHLSSLAQYLQVTIRDLKNMHKASKLGK